MDLNLALERYRRDGFVVWPRLVDPVVVERALADLDARRRPGSPESGMVVCPPGADPLSGDLRLLALAGAVLGGGAELFGATYLVKEARVGPPALWHQDGEPWRRQGVWDAVTVWVALDRTDAGSGGLVVIPGSHSSPAEALVPAAPDEGPDLFGYRMASPPSEPGVALVMQPGDGSLHHPDLVHCSGGNRSGRPRRAMALRYRLATR